MRMDLARRHRTGMRRLIRGGMHIASKPATVSWDFRI